MSMGKVSPLLAQNIDPLNITKRVYWRPDTATTVIKVGQPVCYDSDSTHDYKERTTTPATGGTAYAEGSQNYTGRLFVVEEPQTDNLCAFAGIVTKLGDKAGADGDLIEIATPVEGAVVPVYTDEYCYADRTILGIRNGEADVTYPGRPIGIAMEDIDRATTDGLCWMKFKNFIHDNANETLLVDDEANAVDISGIYKINIEFVQTSGNVSALYVVATSSAGASSNGYGLAAYFEADISAATAAHTAGVGIWMNITGGVQTHYLTALEVGLYESGANLSGCAIVAPLTVRTQLDAANPPAANTHYMMYLRADGPDWPDGLFMAYSGRSVGLTTQNAAVVSHVIPIYVQAAAGGIAAGTYYIMVSNAA